MKKVTVTIERVRRSVVRQVRRSETACEPLDQPTASAPEKTAPLSSPSEVPDNEEKA